MAFCHLKLFSWDVICCLKKKKKKQRENIFESRVSLNLALLAVMLKCCVEICSLLRKPHTAGSQAEVAPRVCTWDDLRAFVRNPSIFMAPESLVFHSCLEFIWVVTCHQVPASSGAAQYQIWAACSGSNNFENLFRCTNWENLGLAQEKKGICTWSGEIAECCWGQGWARAVSNPGCA